jgi:phosphatidylinositol alpha 1,6-mannosyltransferase
MRLVPRSRGGPGDRYRIVIVAESFLPAINGVTNSVLRIVEQLTARGHECVVVAPGPGAVSVAGTPVIRVSSFDLPRYGDLRVGLPIARLTTLLRQLRPDVVHLAAPAVLGAAAARAARRLQLPAVAVYQTDLAGFARRHRLGFATGSIRRWITHVHQQADLTLAPSTAAAWTLRAQGVRDVARWARGVDLDGFHPAHRDGDLRRALAPDGEVIVGYVGRLAPEKQVGRLAEVARAPGVRTVVVGDGPDAASLRRALPTVTFVGARHGSELAAFFASLDVFVHTGLDETFCQSVQEALSSGVPVVAPASGGPLDLVRHGENGYLWHPDAAGSLPGAVTELVRSPALRQRMGRAARASVLDRPWSVLASELLDHYAGVVETRRAERRVA